MSGSDRFGRGQPQAMAKSDGPWGGGGNEAPAGEPAAEPVQEPSEGEPPRNPWLTPDADPPPRRSASIDDIFRKGRGGGAPGGGLLPQASSAAWRWLPWLAAGTMAAWLLSTSVHVLAQDERALVITMGRYSNTIGPGLHMTLPWPLQTVLRRQTGSESLTQIPEKESETLMPTADGELIDVSFQVRWRISDLRQFTFNLPDGEAAIRRLADAEMRASVAELPFDAVWSGRRQADLQQRVLGRVQKVLDAWHGGVTVSAVEVLKAGPPARLADTFQKIGTAKEQASKNREDADRYHDQIIREATVKAHDFDKAFASYKIAPAVTRRKMYDDMMARVLRNNPVVVGGTGMPATLPPGPDAKPQPAPQTQGGQ
ncbi:MAG: protease modulator HflK [Pseudomonadota bacterium]|nr:protease modulator HflK [Pseudomonadota bacterium]